MQVATIGLDIAKNVFWVHGGDARGRTVLRKRLSRARVLGFFAKVGRAERLRYRRYGRTS